jgi:hypothetical protein
MCVFPRAAVAQQQQVLRRVSVDHVIGNGYGVRVSYIGLETHDLVWAPNLNDLRTMSNSVSAYNQPLSARPFPNWA